MEHWFTIEQLNEDTFVISEYRHWEETHCYLLLGTERALLIDTGLGVGDLYRQVRQITSLPVLAAVTHAHWDHLGGYGQFDRRAVHPAERSWLTDHFPLPDTAVREMLARDCLLPADFSLDHYSVFQGEPTRLLEDGQVLDLGGRQLTVLHTPGHSPGHLCFWEQARGDLYTGDLVYRGTLYANYPSTDPQAFLRSVERISALPVQRILPAHHTLEVPTCQITDMREALCALDANRLLHHSSGLHRYNGWSILL